ncbi:MAG: DnaB-like helicase N-terminal domain-containing protein, partial [Lancefieldella rimae]
MPENNVKQDLVRDINPTRLTALEKVAMPQDPEAEMSVLSAMMYDEDARSECIVRLTEEDFYTPSHRSIFKAIKTLFERNSAVDPL